MTNGNGHDPKIPSANTRGSPKGFGRKVLTTGQIAWLFNVAPRTAGKWIDSGRLRGYRVPGTNDRRCLREEVIRFCEAHGIRMPPELAPPVVLVLAGAQSPVRDVVEGFGHSAALALNGFEAGRLAEGAHTALVADLAQGRAEVLGVVRSFRRSYPGSPVLLLTCEDEDDLPTLQGLGDVLRYPWNPEDLRTAVTRLLNTLED